MKLPIVLLGPDRAGKRTIGRLITGRLGLPFANLGALAEPYWLEAGFDQDAAAAALGLDGLYHYAQPFNAHAVERALADHGSGIVAIPSFFSVYDDPALLDRVALAMEPVEHSFLLAPGPDLEESLAVLEDREAVRINGMEINEHFVRHHSNHDLARYRVYTQGKAPEETRDEILAAIDPEVSDIILIGPVGAGKSTLGALLSEKMGLPRVSLDDIRWDYYREIGWSQEAQNAIGNEEGFAGIYRYWKPFEIHGLERMLQDYRGCVMDLGAGHSVYEDDGFFERARLALAPYDNVILVLPSPDLDLSVRVLKARQALVNGMPANRFFLTHPSNRRLARHVIYTEGETPEKTCSRILSLCGVEA
jgi:hypothetical protein